MIIAFILDAILSNYLKSPLLPLLTLTTLIIIYKNNNYYKIAITAGLLYDITYTNTMFVNMFLFLFIAYLIKKLYKFFTDRLINDVIVLLIIITSYRVLYYSILILSKNYLFNISTLYKSVYSSIIINVIYLLLVKIIIKNKKKNIFYW